MNKYKVLPALICIFGALLTGMIFLNHNPESNTQLSTAERLPHDEYETQKNELIGLLEKSGAQASFAYVREQLEISPAFARDCHPLLHQLGHASFKYYDGFNEAMEVADELCNSGYIHGLIEANFESSRTIDEALESSCTDYTENFKQWQCFHGVGHGIMYKDGKDHAKSIEVCKKLKSEFATSSCINGVFMEKFIIVNHAGQHNTNQVSVADISICKEQKDASIKTHCYFYAPTAFFEMHDGKFLDAIKMCNQSESSFIQTCISGVGAQTMKDNITKPSVTADLCEQVIVKYQISCVSGAISLHSNHHASSSATMPLCSNEFKKFKEVCISVTENKRDTLKI